MDHAEELFDLIPGIRDLPYPARLVLMIVLVTLAVGTVLILPHLLW